MSTPLHLNIPEPCHENWQQMTPQEQGRFCGSCQKTVVDFSVMTDKEVLEYFSKASQHVCGRFSNDQLNRELKAPATKKRVTWVYLWNVLLASFLVTKSYAQGKPVVKKPVKNETCEQRTMGLIAYKPENPAEAVVPVTLKGTVTDALSKQPVVGASIVVKDAARGAMADTLGNFQLTVARNKTITLEVSAIGYTPQVQVLDLSTNWQNIQVHLQPAYAGLQEATVIGYGTTKGRVMMGGAVIKCYKVTKTEKIKRVINDWTPAVLKKDVKVYPNPVTRGNSIQVKLVLPQTGAYKLELLNTAGQVMLIQPLLMQTTEQQLDLYTQTSWSAGVYWIRISSPNTKNVYQAKVSIQ